MAIRLGMQVCGAGVPSYVRRHLLQQDSALRLSRVCSPFLVSDGGRLGAVNGVKKRGPTGNRGYAQINAEIAFSRGPLHPGIYIM